MVLDVVEGSAKAARGSGINIGCVVYFFLSVVDRLREKSHFDNLPRIACDGQAGYQSLEIHAGGFFNPRSFAAVDLLPQGTTFNADYFITQVITPLHGSISVREGTRIVANHFCILTILRATLQAWSLMKWFECGASESCIRLIPPISDFCLFGRIKKTVRYWTNRISKKRCW
jgi:hypothetical protein